MVHITLPFQAIIYNYKETKRVVTNEATTFFVYKNVPSDAHFINTKHSTPNTQTQNMFPRMRTLYS